MSSTSSWRGFGAALARQAATPASPDNFLASYLQSPARQLALYYCFPGKSSRTTLFTSEVDSSFESADCWSALSSVGEPDQFSHLPIFHIDSLYFEFRADCSAVAVDLITFSFSNQERAFTYSILGTESLIYPWQTSQLFLRRA